MKFYLRVFGLLEDKKREDLQCTKTSIRARLLILRESTRENLLSKREPGTF